MSGYRIPRVNANVPDAGSKRSREAIETQVVPAKSVRYESSPSICTSPMLHNAHAQPCYLHTRLQCDLSGPAKLDARIVFTTYTRDSPASSPDRKRQAIACHVADTIPSGSFGVQVHPRKRVERKFEEFLAELANEAAKRGLESRDA